MITTAALIAKFKFALDNNWGYIYGTAGVIWTQSKQDALVNSFKSKYGANWKNNESAKKADKYYGALNGGKWVGHTVADCSGLFYWAFKQLGGYMYHGSNTMYNKYCTSKGKLTKKGRTDGKPLKAGTAVFTGNESEHGHVGLYIGNDTVIEASGTNAGVITTKISGGKWTYWGEMKGVDYTGAAEETPVQESEKQEVATQTATVIGKRLALRTGPSTNDSIIMRVDTNEKVEVLDEQWVKVRYKGKTGYMMAKYLKM